MNCTFCAEPAVLYLQRFQGRKKAASYPVCVKHSVYGWAYQEFGQQAARDALARLLPVGLSSIPRFRLSQTR